jgi:hypothetical protein
VTVDVVAVAELTIACCYRTLCGYFGAIDFFCLSCVVDSVRSRLSLPAVFHRGILFLTYSCWFEVTSLLCYGLGFPPGSGMYSLLWWQFCTLVVLWCVIDAGGFLRVRCYCGSNTHLSLSVPLEFHHYLAIYTFSILQ